MTTLSTGFTLYDRLLRNLCTACVCRRSAPAHEKQRIESTEQVARIHPPGAISTSFRLFTVPLVQVIGVIPAVRAGAGQSQHDHEKHTGDQLHFAANTDCLETITQGSSFKGNPLDFRG